MANQNTAQSLNHVMPVEIVECASKAQRRRFIEFQWQIYKGDAYWVPPLISEREAFYDRAKNPFFEHSDVAMFMALREGKVVGTISAIHNKRHNMVHNDKVGFFGSFEAINDSTVSTALFDAVRNWLKARGLDAMRGPATFSANDEYGLLIEGFDSEPQVLMTYNPRYYIDLIEQYGFSKAMDLYAWWASTEKSSDFILGKRFEQIAERAMKRGKFSVRTINFSNLEAEVEAVKKIYNQAWSANWGFVPLTDLEIDHLVKSLKPIADPNMIFIAEKDGEPIGVSLSLPNVNHPLRMANPRPGVPELWTLLKFLWYRRKHVNALRLVILGVLPQYRMSGVDTFMIYSTLKVAIEKKLLGGECSWILETNDAMNRVIQLVEPELYKKYRMYQVAI